MSVHLHMMPTQILCVAHREVHREESLLTTFLRQITKLFLKSLNLTHVLFSMRYAHHPLQQIMAGIKRERSCASIHYMIFAYCVTLHYFQISFKIKICKLVTTSCLTPSQPAMVISAHNSFSFVAPVMCFAFILVLLVLE